MPIQTDVSELGNQSRKQELTAVTERVSKTKKEIEQLKAQLQHLIQDGIVNKPNVTESKVLNGVSTKSVDSSENPKNNAASASISSHCLSRKPTVPPPIPEVADKKVPNYNKQAAREYIKKQRQKWRELTKNQTNNEVVTNEVKKQRLEALRKKSLELVSNNIQHKRERSRSRDKQLQQEVVFSSESIKPQSLKTKAKKKVIICENPELNNITIRSKNLHLSTQTDIDFPSPSKSSFVNAIEVSTQFSCTLPSSEGKLPEKRLETFRSLLELRRDLAAKKIQRAFRAFLSRKSREKSVSLKEKHEVPAWLEAPTSIPYPHNFINAVKRKLQSSLQQIASAEKKNAAVQSSFNEDNKTVNQTSLKSFLSCKLMNQNVFEPLVVPGASFVSKKDSETDSDTCKNIPELSSEDGGLTSKRHSHKRSHSSEMDAQTKINLDRVKKLRLLEPKRLNFSRASETSNNMKLLLNGSGCISNSARKDSIITYNKCNYSERYEVVKEQQSEVSKTNEHRSTIKTESYMEIQIPQETLTTFRDYMKNMDGTHLKSSEILPNIAKDGETGSGVTEELREYSNSFMTASTRAGMLEYPSVSLQSRISAGTRKSNSDKHPETIKSEIVLATSEETRVKSNKIHMKFEAELHLLNEFNDSLRQVMALEKSLTDLNKNNDETEKSTGIESRHLGTSSRTRTLMESIRLASDGKQISTALTEIPTINYSRGSEVSEHTNILATGQINGVELNDTTVVTTGLELSQLNETSLSLSTPDATLSLKENCYEGNMQAGFLIEMFEQLIKDEDVRIDNLKTILNIREKSLVDRTKSELSRLEVQKKFLRDSGQLQEISVIKKKQRGLLIKLEHERHEMQRLKHLQKMASKERKTVLREKRNTIKTQLSNTGNAIPRIKRNARVGQHQSGPLRVYNVKLRDWSIRSEKSTSETSVISKEDVLNVVSHTIDKFMEEPSMLHPINKETTSTSSKPLMAIQNVKRTLLMREAALQKRRRVAEELLQWHRRLVEEEAKITELELAASAIINRRVSSAIPDTVSDKVNNKKEGHKFKGSQLNLLWYNMTGREEKKYSDSSNYSISAHSLQRFCKDAKKYANRIQSSGTTRSSIQVQSDAGSENTENDCVKVENRSPSQIAEYTSDFDSVATKSDLNTVASVQTAEKTKSPSSIEEKLPSASAHTLNDSSHGIDTSDSIGSDKKCDEDAEGRIETPILEDQRDNFANEISERDQFSEWETTQGDSQTNDDEDIQEGLIVNNDISNEPNQLVPNKSDIETSLDSKSYRETNESVTKIGNDQISLETDRKDVDVQLKTDFSSIDSIESTEEQNENFCCANQDNKKVISEEIEDEISEHPEHVISEDFPNDAEVETSIFIAGNISEAMASKSDGNGTEELRSNEIINSVELLNENAHVSDHQITSECNIISGDAEKLQSDVVKTETTKSPVGRDETNCSSISEIDDSPVLLSYGYVEKGSPQLDSTADDSEKSQSVMEANLSADNEEVPFEENINFNAKDVETSNASEVSEESHRTMEEENISETGVESSEKKINVKQRVFEILADANIQSPRELKSPRLQDLYVTAYDVQSPEPSSESGSLVDEVSFYGSDEVEELLKKQLEIEQEIKHIQQQQQKEHIPYVYVREIPNKPPPPYTPPSAIPTPVAGGVLPATEKQVEVITGTSAKIIYASYLEKKLYAVSLSSEKAAWLSDIHNVDANCFEFIFDLCKEVAIEHYRGFEEEFSPSWMRPSKLSKLAVGKPLDEKGLERYICRKIKQQLGYETVNVEKHGKYRWSGKKRDHVDDLLVMECQSEESDWIDYGRDEAIVKNDLTREIMNNLLIETIPLLKNILTKRRTLY